MFGNEPTERERTYDVEHIKIEVKLDLKNKTLDGIVTTEIRSAADDFRSFKVDAVGMNVKSVKECLYNHTDNPELAETYEDIPFEYDKKEITVNLEHKVAKNFPFKYRVEYSITDPEKGLYFIAPDSIFPNKRYEVWTQGEGEDNRYWFPCYDYPNDKATTEVIITTDVAYQTLSNGELIMIIENPDGTRTWHWSLSKPHSSYLVMLAVGNYDVVEDGWKDVPIFSYGPPGELENIKRCYGETDDIIKFFSEYSNYKYPWGRFSQVAVQDFIYGGMENTGAVVLFDGSVYDDRVPPDYNATGLVAHELAHMWWGDVVTCKNWNEIWLNEGFATYFEALYKEYSLGKDEFDYSILKKSDEVLEVDSIKRMPIYTRHGLTTNTYSKGALVLNMLRHQMGDEMFKKALNNYITKYEYQNVVTKNLLDEVNGIFNNNPEFDRKPVDFSYFFEEWIYKAGQPEFKGNYRFNYSTNELSLNILQIQNPKESSVFQTPVEVELVTEKSKKKYTIRTTTVRGISNEYKLDGKLLNVNFNPGNSVLCKAYVTKPKEMWLYQLEKSENAIDRIMAARGLKDFINDYDVIDRLSWYMRNDKFWGVRNEIPAVFTQLTDFDVPLMLMTDFDDEQDPRVKRSMLTAIGSYFVNNPDYKNRDTVIGLIMSRIKGNKSYYITADGIIALSKIADKDKLYDLVAPFINENSHNEIIRRSVIEALIESKDSRAVDIYKEYAIRGSTSRLRSYAIAGLEDFVDDATVIDVLNKKLSDRSRGIRSRVVDILSRAPSASSKPYLEELLKRTNDDDLSIKIKELLSKIEKSL